MMDIFIKITNGCKIVRTYLIKPNSISPDEVINKYDKDINKNNKMSLLINTYV
jgi:hypothetical protein